jgi:hypothetical protein
MAEKRSPPPPPAPPGRSSLPATRRCRASKTVMAFQLREACRTVRPGTPRGVARRPQRGRLPRACHSPGRSSCPVPTRRRTAGTSEQRQRLEPPARPQPLRRRYRTGQWRASARRSSGREGRPVAGPVSHSFDRTSGPPPGSTHNSRTACPCPPLPYRLGRATRPSGTLGIVSARADEAAGGCSCGLEHPCRQVACACQRPCGPVEVMGVAHLLSSGRSGARDA